MKKLVKHTYNRYGFWEGETFYPTFVHGLGSVLSITLECLTKSNKEARKINAKYSFLPYKDGDENEDVWEKFFSPPNLNIKTYPTKFNAQTVASSDYSFLKDQMHLLSPYVEKYFSPSLYVMDTYNQFKETYNIDLDNTIALHYRATDKNHYLYSTSYDLVVANIEKILNIHPEMRVMIQSDENNITDYFLNKFDNSFYLKELPQSTTGWGVHVTRPYNLRLKYGIDYLTSLILISRCRYMFTHYGNGGFWSCLYRGNFENTILV